MKPEDFKDIVTNMYDKCLDLLYLKEKDYSDGKDRLIQFKNAAKLTDLDTLYSLRGMMVKHTTKLYQMLNDHGFMHERFTEAQWDEIICDQINYLYLLKAVLVDENLIKGEPE